MNVRKSITQHSNEILDKLRQIGRDQKLWSVEFNSDGSHHPSKTVVGSLFKVGRNNRGLRLYIRTQADTIRVASWRLPKDVVDVVIGFIRDNNYRNGKHVSAI